MRIAFFGTSDRSQPILESLKENFDLKLCLTKSASKRGRKQTVTETQVKDWADSNNVPVITIDSFNKQAVVKELKEKLIELEIELVISADFSLIIPEEIFSFPPLKIVNIHFSLLPKLRGASPVQHAILNGFEKTGITFHLVESGMDTGDIISQEEYQLFGYETSDELYEKMFHLAAERLPSVIRKYAGGELKPAPQDENQATYCYSKSHPKSTFIFKEDAKINWAQKNVEEIERAIRAYQPWPVSWSTLADLEKNQKLSDYFELKDSVDPKLTIKLYQAKLSQNKLMPLTVQVEGKNKVDWKSFLNGYSTK